MKKLLLIALASSTFSAYAMQTAAITAAGLYGVGHLTCVWTGYVPPLEISSGRFLAVCGVVKESNRHKLLPQMPGAMAASLRAERATITSKLQRSIAPAVVVVASALSLLNHTQE